VNLATEPGLGWDVEPACVLHGALFELALEAWLKWRCPNDPLLVKLRARTNVGDALRLAPAEEPDEGVGMTSLISSAGANEPPIASV
jgi:hypothetical protein